jgi:hypothetical protein
VNVLPLVWPIEISEIVQNILRITAVSDFVHRPVFYKPENKVFRKLDLFPSSGEGGRHVLCWSP